MHPLLQSECIWGVKSINFVLLLFSIEHGLMAKRYNNIPSLPGYYSSGTDTSSACNPLPLSATENSTFCPSFSER